jgi:hypothetical protein
MYVIDNYCNNPPNIVTVTFSTYVTEILDTEDAETYGKPHAYISNVNDRSTISGFDPHARPLYIMKSSNYQTRIRTDYSNRY